jgi:hypothetical protein
VHLFHHGRSEPVKRECCGQIKSPPSGEDRARR